MIAQDRDITSLGDLFFADWKHHFRDTVFAKEGPGPKNHSEIGSDILHHKFQEMDRKSKGMIAMYSSNYRSIPGLCLPLILLSFEGSTRAGMMGEEGVPPLCSFKPGICTKETAHQGMYLCHICETLVFFHGMVIDSFMDFNSSSWIFISDYLKSKILKIHKHFSWIGREIFSCWCWGNLVHECWEITQWE